MRDPGYKALELAAIGVARLEASLRRTQRVVSGFAEGFFGGALDTREASALGLKLYEHAYRSGERPLLDWEETLFAECWPTPGRLLVGGAGDGREAIALTQRGHDVDAFEPASAIASECERRLGAERTFALGYEQLSAAVLDGAQNEASPIAARRYDGVLLGWNSFMHVLDRRERERAIVACNRLSDGPIVASFWVDEGRGGNRHAAALGAAVGSAISRARGRASVARPRLRFGTHYGFVEALTRAEVEAIAKTVGRSVAWGGLGHVHVVLRR